VKLPPRPVLTFAIGIKPLPPVESTPGSSAEPGGRANKIRFVIRAGTDRPSMTVFQREIHRARRDEWIDQSVDLSRFAGKEIWLSFEAGVAADPSTADREEGPLPFAALFGEPIVHDRARYREGKAVIVISVDTLRRDHMSVHGYPKRTTPTLKELAKESAVFDDAVTTAPWTLPAHASLFTSVYPSIHGAVDLRQPLPGDLESLPRLLQRTGYFTGAVVTHLYLSKQYGFGHGFDRHTYSYDARGQWVTDRAVAFLRERGDRDFFLFLHYYDPHWHYDPPPPYDRTFDPNYQGSATGVWWNFKEESRETIAEDDYRHIVALYDGEILYTDRELGRLFREMKQLGVFDKALVVVTSDHGEEFLEHGSWEHQKTLYDEVISIPLLVKLPGGKGKGRRMAEQVSLVDVAPTIVDALGLSVPAEFQGRSLLGAIGGSDTPSESDAWAETQHTVDGSHKVSLRHGEGGKKLIVSMYEDGREPAIELYDLARDPSEAVNLAETDSSWLDQALQRVESFLLDASERRRTVAPQSPVQLTPDELDKLRALGYVR
jgi:arylsulfatase A-like enzyme